MTNNAPHLVDDWWSIDGETNAVWLWQNVSIHRVQSISGGSGEWNDWNIRDRAFRYFMYFTCCHWCLYCILYIVLLKVLRKSYGYYGDRRFTAMTINANTHTHWHIEWHCYTEIDLILTTSSNEFHSSAPTSSFPPISHGWHGKRSMAKYLLHTQRFNKNSLVVVA